MEKTTNKSVFATLNATNVNEHTEKKNGLTYLSWAWAWRYVKSIYPDANYRVVYFEGRPYLADDVLGYMVATEVTINGETIGMHLPVMDSKNKAQKSMPYDITTKYGSSRVEAATMFDINTAIMRCLTKNLSMFGLGLYIYSGEDLPDEVGVTMETTTLTPETETPAPKKASKPKKMEELRQEPRGTVTDYLINDNEKAREYFLRTYGRSKVEDFSNEECAEIYTFLIEKGLV